MPSPKFSNKPKPSITLAFEAIGTLWRIKYTGEESEALAMSDAISQRILTFDTHYSRFRSDSLVTQLSKHLATTQMPDDFAPLIQFYRKLYDVTDGLVTPLIGLALSDAGYDTHYSFQPRSIRPTPAWDDALTYKNNQLSVRQSVMLDFGAAGKGYLVDILANILQERGIYEYTIDAGGDIAHHGTDPNYVGLEDPTNTTMVIGITELTNRSICGSAGNRRRWEGYTHILNPLTRQSPTDITAVWVIADTTMLADGLATALSFVEPVALIQFDFEYLLIYHDGRRQASPGFPVRYFDEPKIYELT